MLRDLGNEFWLFQNQVVILAAGRTLTNGGKAQEVVEKYRELMEAAGVPHSVAICLKAQLLYYALEHPELPLSEVVVLSFYAVHDFICHSRAENDGRYRVVFAAFPAHEWDKGMLLRRRLVASFLSSRWPRLDFVRAARNPRFFRDLLPLFRDHQGGWEFLSELSWTLSQAGASTAQFFEELDDFLHPTVLGKLQRWLL